MSGGGKCELALLVAKCVFHLGLASISSAREVVVSHGNGNVAVQFNVVVIKDNIAPTFAAIDCKATILSNSISLLHSFGTHKVRHGLACLRAELDILGFCWLEEHIAMTIAVQFTSCLSSCSHIVSAIQVGLGNLLDGIRPCFLGSFHLFH
eukprot:Skav207773  [mRNA]  locus=scaffold2087:200633:201930:+ [translate_table: standard]